MQVYIYPLKCETSILEDGELEQIFSNAEQLLCLNSELLWALEERLHRCEASAACNVGDLFLRLV